MMKSLIFCLFLFLNFNSISQTIADFENLLDKKDSFLNGSDGSGGFESGNIFLPNYYDQNFGYWSSWAISSITDNISQGPNNQYSAIDGSGQNGSQTYAVCFVDKPVTLILNNNARGGIVNGIYITNASYAYYSIRDGDAFAKMFGGESGNDADYFLLKIKKWYAGMLSESTIDFYLADFRFTDNSKDYIIDEWTYVSLSELGQADSLQFSLTSTDNGQFGMNTPAYFCIDNVNTADGVNSIFEEGNLALNLFVYPNNGILKLSNASNIFDTYQILNYHGQNVQEGPVHEEIPLRNLTNGQYIIVFKRKDKSLAKKIIIF